MEEFCSQFEDTPIAGRKSQLSEYELTGPMAPTVTKQTTLIAGSLLTVFFYLGPPPHGMVLSTFGVDLLTSVNSVEKFCHR